MKKTWFLVSFLAGALIASSFFLVRSSPQDKKCLELDYVNPDFSCGNSFVIDKSEYTTLRNDLIAFITESKTSGSIQEASVYFRDLRSGPTFSIDAYETYAPASLLKLPVVMALFHEAEDNATTLETPLKYASSEVADFPDMVQFEKPDTNLKEGETYPIKDLMRSAMVYSDNVAFYTLIKYLNYRGTEGGLMLLRSFQELGVIDPRTPNESVVSVRAYAGLFRTLYNASYLSVENSEMLLKMLSESTYDRGLAAGVPEGVTVANKFGERLLEDGTKQLHDCGIIYFPGNPYLLCIMTQGKEWDTLAHTIGTISQMIYKEVNARRL